MATIIEKTGKTVEEALQAALDELGVPADQITYEILENPSKGFFGFGAKPAKIRVTLKDIPAPAAEPETISSFEAAVEVEEKSEPAVEIEEKPAPAAEVSANVEEPPTPIFNEDMIIDAAQDFLAEVFRAMHIDVKISTTQNDAEIIFDLSGENLGALIGKHGQTLDALQYLTNLAANRHDAPKKIYFVLDIENYRARRADALKKLAKSVAERAIRTKKDVKLEPMSRNERRIIHTVLQDNEKVETHSSGEDPYRYIIVSPKKRQR